VLGCGGRSRDQDRKDGRAQHQLINSQDGIWKLSATRSGE